MKIWKNLLMLCIVAVLFLATMAIGLVSAQGTLFVNPPSIVDETKIAGTTFTITVEVDAGVTNLWGYEFILRYDTVVLTATKSTPTANFPDVSFNMINDTAGWVWVAASLPMGVTEGLNGPLTLVTIEFSVDAIGESTLDIDEDSVILLSAAGKPIIPTIVDGYFRNTFLSDIGGPVEPDHLPDGVVDIWDLRFIGLAYGKTSGYPDWDDYKIADIRGPEGPPDGKVDIWDLRYCGLEYGSSIWV